MVSPFYGLSKFHETSMVNNLQSSFMCRLQVNCNKKRFNKNSKLFL